jgi:hypothetical protein
MPSILAALWNRLGRLWRIDPALTATALLMIPLLGFFAVGLWLDPRTVLGAPVWSKPAKFAASIAVYCFTLVWLFGNIPSHVRTRRIVGRTTVVAMLVEIGIIGAQSARGTTSHFNVGSPLDAVLWAVMGLAIIAQTISSVAVAVALFRQPFADRALGWALRLGMVITIAGASFGGLMTRPTRAQLAEMKAGQVTASGAHTVGAPDGGPGLAAVGWSREHGDLRVPHFLGLHAVQVLPLLAFALRRTRASRDQQRQLVLTLAGSYVGLLALLLWQALRGQALIRPDTTSLTALLLWAGLSVAFVHRAFARRLPDHPRAGETRSSRRVSAQPDLLPNARLPGSRA